MRVVHVKGDADGRAFQHGSRVGDFVRRNRLLRQVRLGRRADGQLAPDAAHYEWEVADGEGLQRRREPRLEGTQICDEDDSGVEVIVDDRWRAERPVEREPNPLIGPRLIGRREPRREDRIADVAELVDAPADREVELFQKDLVLHVRAGLGAVLRRRRNRDVEVVLPHVAAECEHLVRSGRDRIAHLNVVRLRFEVELDWFARRRVV